MNKLPVIVVSSLIVIINIYLHLNASVGCLDNDWHMAKRYDYKNYHKVECNCPCWKYKQTNDRNKCTRCLHYHKPTAENWTEFGIRKPVQEFAPHFKTIKKRAVAINNKKIVAPRSQALAKNN